MYKRIILLLLGFLIIGFSVATLRFIDLGMDPFGAMTLGLAESFRITFGTVMMVVQVLLFIAVATKRRDLVGIGTIIGMFGIGYIVDGLYLLMNITIEGNITLAIRLVVLIAILIVVSFGVSLVITANLGLIPYDALGLVIEDVTTGKLKFNWVRMGTDAFCAVIAFLLGAPIGIATFMTVFMIGPFVNFFKNKVGKIVRIAV